MLAFTFSSATSVLASLPSSLASTLVSVAEADLDLARALDHVGVRQDVPILVDHEARPGRLAALLLGKPERRLAAGW